jgi:hypothetical protein
VRRAQVCIVARATATKRHDMINARTVSLSDNTTAQNLAATDPASPTIAL